MSVPEKWLPGGTYYQATLEKIKSPNGIFSLDGIPSDVLNEEMALAWVSTKISGLYYVPVHLRTAKVCKMAIEKSAYNITSAPVEVLDQEMCMIAMKGGAHLDVIPSKFINEEIVLTYINNSKGFDVLGNIPIHFRNEKVCTEAYRSSECSMKNIPRELQFVVYENGVLGDFESNWKKMLPPLALGPPVPLVRSYATVQYENDAPLVRQSFCD